MIIESVRVRNFRCIRDETLPLDKLTALIGSNGSGKSCFLKALAIFFSEENCNDEDFFANDVTNPIQISVTFNGLGKYELDEFISYVQNDRLTVTMVIEFPFGKNRIKYVGTRLANPDFNSIRNGGSATDVKTSFDELIKMPDYQILKTYIDGRASESKIKAALDRWEQENPTRLTPINDDGQFFGYRQVGGWRIEKYCKFVYIPASGDIDEIAVDGKKSPISILLDISVRNVLSNNKELNELVTRTEQEYNAIIASSMSKDLSDFNTLLSKTFSSFAPGNALDVKWNTENNLVINNPRADVRIVERGYSTNIQGAGDGSKRALIMTLLHHLAIVQPFENKDELMNVQADHGCEIRGRNDEINRGLIIAIEEPELFQHPGRQRNISKLLYRLSNECIMGVSNSNQIIFSTHSPILIDIDRFEQIRLVRKEVKGAKCGETVVASTTLKAVNEMILDSQQSLKTPNEYREKAQLSAFINPEVSEGFFSDLVVLVEGDEDRTALQCTAQRMGHDFDEMNIKIVPCGSKNSIPKAYAVFDSLTIPTYVLWDSDYSGQGTERINETLQRLVGADDIVPYPDSIEEQYSCFKENMTAVLEYEIPNYAGLIPSLTEKLGISRKRGGKNPLLIRSLFDEAYASDGKTAEAPETLKKIIDQIIKRRNQFN